MRHIAATVFFIAFLAPWPCAAATNNISLKQLQQIAESGTPGLALKLLDEAHPGTQKGFGEWFRWSQARTAILVKWKQWQRAIDYLQRLPSEPLPENLYRWSLSQRAWLQLEQGNASQARTLLRQLLWQVGQGEPNHGEQSLLRRLVIRSYLVDDRIDDAATAMYRYQQDYPSVEPEWLQLRARILLRQQKPHVLLEWPLTTRQKLPPTLLMLIALRSAQRTPQAIYTEALVHANDVSLTLADRARYWKIAAEASALSGRLADTVLATERALGFADDLSSSDRVFQVTTSDLWGVYQRYGTDLGNQKQLLIGDDAAWFSAVEAVREENPLQAKGLLSVVAQQAGSDALRGQALTQLATLLESDPGGLRLVARLFSDQNRFPGFRQVPVNVRHQLVEYALSNSNIVMASDLLATLTQQPDDTDKFTWHLRRARVLVLGGRPSEGVDVIDTLLTEQLFISPEQLDKLMQVLFDLQSAEYHQRALALFIRLENERQLAPTQRRELFFWMAESFTAVEQFAQAGLYYMRSATYVDSDSADLWGQSARYNAAESLAKAGLISDARRLYESLLKITEDPARRAVLRGKLQQLWVSPADSGDIKGVSEESPY